MSKNNIIIRKVVATDNAAIQKVIQDTFIEFNLPLTGTAYADAETKAMYQAYQEKNAVYYIIEQNNLVVGGAGIKKLNDSDKNICEVQKMYFSPIIRGKGYGKLLFEKCLQKAKEFGYQQCYLESASQLKAAVHIYEKYGFKHLEKPIGNTGHFSCGIFMLKSL